MITSSTRDYLNYLGEWSEAIQDKKLSEIVKIPANTAVFVVDVTHGFCTSGPLSSPRVGKIVDPIVNLLKIAWELGIPHYLLPQDTHDPRAEEFNEYPPHCVRGTQEAETVEKIKALAFYDRMIIFEKNSINSGVNPGVSIWLNNHPEVDTYILTGDCTDLCIYQLATYLKADANERQVHRRVIIPADCVDTYHMSVETAKDVGGFPHDAELLHLIFLNHMALNGIEIYRQIQG